MGADDSKADRALKVGAYGSNYSTKMATDAVSHVYFTTWGEKTKTQKAASYASEKDDLKSFKKTIKESSKKSRF